MKKQTTNTKTMKKQNTTPAQKCTPAPQCLTQQMQDQLNRWDFTTPVTLWKSVHASGWTGQMVRLAKAMRPGHADEVCARFSFELKPAEQAKYDQAWDLYQGRSSVDYEKSQELYLAAKTLGDTYEAEKRQAFRDWWLENTNKPAGAWAAQAEKFSSDVATIEELSAVAGKTLRGLKGMQALSTEAISRRMGMAVHHVEQLRKLAREIMDLYASGKLPTREQSEALQQAQKAARRPAYDFDSSGLKYEKETAAKDALNAASSHLDQLEDVPALESTQDENSYRVDILSDLLAAHDTTSAMDYKHRPMHGAAYTAWADLRKELRQQLKHLKAGQTANLDSIAESVAVLKLVRGMAISKELNRELQEGKASDKAAPAWHEAVDAFEHFLGEFKAFEQQAAEGKKEQAKEVAKK